MFLNNYNYGNSQQWCSNVFAFVYVDYRCHLPLVEIKSLALDLRRYLHISLSQFQTVLMEESNRYFHVSWF